MRRKGIETLPHTLNTRSIRPAEQDTSHESGRGEGLCAYVGMQAVSDRAVSEAVDAFHRAVSGQQVQHALCGRDGSRVSLPLRRHPRLRLTLNRGAAGDQEALLLRSVTPRTPQAAVDWGKDLGKG